MNKLLEALYDRFHEKPELAVLWLIDDESAIANALSLDSFLGGFALAWKLTTE